MTFTYTDMAVHVDQALDAGHGSDDFDRDAIVQELIDTYGLVDPDTIPHDDFWAIVQKHDQTVLSPDGALRELTNAIRGGWSFSDDFTIETATLTGGAQGLVIDLPTANQTIYLTVDIHSRA